MSYEIADLKGRMSKTIEALTNEYTGLRTGRAHPSLLDPIQVDAYGALMPLNQCASVAVGDARMLLVNVWDASLADAVEKAIRESDLGLNPQAEGQSIRVPIPELNAERRAEMAKQAGKLAENARIAVRNVRRDGMDAVKSAQKDSDVSEDEARRISDDIQKLTDEFIKTIDDTLAKKEQDITSV